MLRFKCCSRFTAWIPAGDAVRLPAVLHLPNQGSLQITSADSPDALLGYAARRNGIEYVKVTFPAANAEHVTRSYRLRVTAIVPHLAGIRGDARYDGFRRNYLNALQMQAHLGVLADNAASDPCPFVLYQYAEVARYAPPLAPGLTALDLLRVTLDRYLSGFRGYGMPGYEMFDVPKSINAADESVRYEFSDVLPSLLISSGTYFQATHDRDWLMHAYPALKRWAGEMLAEDTDGNGLIEYPASGNSNSWHMHDGKVGLRPANWWDTIGFGHEDAYSNALAYKALIEISTMALQSGHLPDAQLYSIRARRLRAAFTSAFLNPRTGVLAGWRSTDGVLNDYYFHWVNGVAIYYGLVDDELAKNILKKLINELEVVHYNSYQYGLPGNLIPVPPKDYVHLEHRWGGATDRDGTDAFQIYENGGATAS